MTISLALKFCVEYNPNPDVFEATISTPPILILFPLAQSIKGVDRFNLVEVVDDESAFAFTAKLCLFVGLTDDGGAKA